MRSTCGGYTAGGDGIGLSDGCERVRPRPFLFVPRANNHDEIFVVVDGRRIASRGQPGTPEAGIWVSIVPGYTVLDKNDGEDIVVYFDGKVLQ